MKTKVETGVMLLQAKQCEEPPEAGSGPWANVTLPDYGCEGLEADVRATSIYTVGLRLVDLPLGTQKDVYLGGSFSGSVAEGGARAR